MSQLAPVIQCQGLLSPAQATVRARGPKARYVLNVEGSADWTRFS